MLSDEDIKIVEQDTTEQAKGPGFFRHRAGRIGSSVSGAVYHSNIAQPSKSVIKTVCYPHLYKVNSKAIRHGCKYEEYAVKAYETHMKKRHETFKYRDLDCLLTSSIHSCMPHLISKLLVIVVGWDVAK